MCVFFLAVRKADKFQVGENQVRALFTHRRFYVRIVRVCCFLMPLSDFTYALYLWLSFYPLFIGIQGRPFLFKQRSETPVHLRFKRSAAAK